MGLLTQFLLDRRREKKLEKNFNAAQKTRPEYEIPGALAQSAGLAYNEATMGELPGYASARDRNDVSAANSLAAAGEAGNVLGVVPAVQAAKAGADLGLETANADYRRSNLGMLYAVNQQLAGAQDTKFQMNEFAPWKDKYNMANQLTDLSYQRWTNLNQGVTDMAMQVAGAMIGMPGLGAGGSNFFGGNQNVSPRDAMGR